FFGGTMFWCRLDFLEPLLRSPEATPADFNSERGQVDATTAHAVERLLGGLLHTVSKKKMYSVKDTAIKELPKKPYNEKYKFVH
ncbi:MAG: rhamnan synthesis F family protein, partial [Candidatus Saccharimonas sp.]